MNLADLSTLHLQRKRAISQARAQWETEIIHALMSPTTATTTATTSTSSSAAADATNIKRTTHTKSFTKRPSTSDAATISGETAGATAGIFKNTHTNSCLFVQDGVLSMYGDGMAWIDKIDLASITAVSRVLIFFVVL